MESFRLVFLPTTPYNLKTLLSILDWYLPFEILQFLETEKERGKNIEIVDQISFVSF